MRDALQRHRSTLVIAGFALLAVLVAVLAAGGPRTGADHDPENPGQRGARAVARVLAEQGVEIEVVRSAEALERQTLDAATTVLVTSASNLGRSTARRLRTAAAEATVIVAAPRPGTAETLVGEGVVPQPSVPEAGVVGNCTDTGIGDLSDLRIEYEQGLSYPTTSGCFGQGAGWVVASADRGLIFLGAPEVLENDSVLRADNAAAALRLLGQRDRLVWYIPNVQDLRADDGVSLRTLLPRWVIPGLWLIGLALVGVIWWRARRLGPLAVEPLPVSVRSLETTEARGRLYRSASDRQHAAAHLRTATRASLARHLRLPPSDASVLARDVAARIDRSIAEVESLIADSGPLPTTDDELIQLAKALADLDREVRRT